MFPYNYYGTEIKLKVESKTTVSVAEDKKNVAGVWKSSQFVERERYQKGIDKIRDEVRKGRRSTTVRKTSPGLENESVWVKHV